jgi:hypothetical protein
MAQLPTPAARPRQDDTEILSVRSEIHHRETESLDSPGRVVLAQRSNANQEVLSC